MKKLFVSIALLVAISLSTSGFSTFIHTAIPIPLTAAGYESDEIAIAVDYSGVKYIARTECPTSGVGKCKLVFTRVAPGIAGHSITLYSELPTVGTYSDVDVAVTDSGIAFFVYRWTNDAGTLSYLEYRRSNDPSSLHLIETTLFVSGKPIAVARGENVYVVYSAQSVNYYYLLYRRLNPDTPVWGGMVDYNASVNYTLFDAAVGWNGYLYVLYLDNPNTIYADNYGVTGDMTKRFAVGSYTNTAPDIDVNGGLGVFETVYIIYYRFNIATPDDLYIGHCPANNCISGVTYFNEIFPLDPAQNYKIWGDPRIIGDIVNTAYYIFTATRVASPGRNVYAGGFQVGTPLAVPTQMTDTPEAEADAQICLIASVNPVAAWHIDRLDGSFGDIFEFDFIKFLRTVRKTNSGTAEGELACNADWGAGIWNEDTGVKQAWVSYNTFPAILPLIKK
ncbi:MAG: hypothetical protein WBV22_03050 [Anaerolineaceae bacterium]